MAAKSKKAATIEVMELKTITLDMFIVGNTPMVCNAMSEKVQRELVAPERKRNRAAREASLKHHPVREYRNSVYRAVGDEAPTRIVFPGGGIKAAIANAALDIPGAAKAQIGRLAWVNEWNVPIYGVPQMFMATVRNSDMRRTPDIRTRAILPEWAAQFSITFPTPQLNETSIANLAAAAGLICGLGDGRPQKGKLNFGQFRLATSDDVTYRRIVKDGGLAAQDAAFTDFTFFDEQTERLYNHWRDQAEERGFEAELEVA